MSICRARLHDTSNALTFRMSGEQIGYVFNSRLNCSESTAGSSKWSGCSESFFPATENARVPKSSAANSQNCQLMTSGRSQMLATRNLGDCHTVVGEVAWSSVAKTTMNCHTASLYCTHRGITSQCRSSCIRQTTLVFSGHCDQTYCSILNMLQLVHELLRRGRQNRVTIVDARCDKSVYQWFYGLNVQRAMSTSLSCRSQKKHVLQTSETWSAGIVALATRSRA